ncbi:MAG: PDZ domain-containing protein, partial [Kouleothrix sp.]
MILPLTRQTRKTTFTATTAEPYNWLMQALSAMILIVILATATVFWPAPDPGYENDAETATVTFVEPGGIAEQAGLQVGDQILEL